MQWKSNTEVKLQEKLKGMTGGRGLKWLTAHHSNGKNDNAVLSRRKIQKVPPTQSRFSLWAAHGEMYTWRITIIHLLWRKRWQTQQKIKEKKKKKPVKSYLNKDSKKEYRCEANADQQWQSWGTKRTSRLIFTGLVDSENSRNTTDFPVSFPWEKFLLTALVLNRKQTLRWKSLKNNGEIHICDSKNFRFEESTPHFEIWE